MKKSLVVRRLLLPTCLKLYALGSSVVLAPLFVLLCVANIAWSPFVRWEDDYVSGALSLFAGPMALLLAVFLAGLVLTGCAALGLYLFSLVRPVKIAFLAEPE